MSAQIMAALRAPFHPQQVRWRLAEFDGRGKNPKGIALAYVDARDVAERLDDVMGADWSSEFVPMPNGTCCCRITLHLESGPRWRSNGAGETEKEAAKGAYSDAFKRAAAMWGIGAYLYALRPQIVDVVFINGKAQIAQHEHARLQRLLGAADDSDQAPPAHTSTPAHIEPEDSEAIFKVVKVALDFCVSEDALRDWAHTVGHRSDKWSLMLPEHRSEMAALARAKLAQIKDKDAEARRKMAETIAGEQAALQLGYQPEREPGEDDDAEPDQAAA